MAKFGVLYADCPWKFLLWSKQKYGRTAETHYDCMTLDDLCGLPVQGVCADDCVLFLWTTWPMLAGGEATRLLEAWGFEGKTGLPWLKIDRSNLPRMGMGYHDRQCSEPLIIATRGRPRCPEPWERVEAVLFSRPGAHSAKPDDLYPRIERYKGPYLEMFARPDGDLFPFDRPDWTQIGNEITGNDIAFDLRRLAALTEPVPFAPAKEPLGRR